MSKEPSSFDLSPEKLARLWSVGSDVNKDEDEVDQEQKKAELLRDWLESALPLDPALAELLPTVLMRMFRELRPFAGESFNSLLLDPETDVSALKKIKSFSKKLVEAAKSEAEHDAAAAIYYAAIASVLVFHNQRITTFSYESLADSFSTSVENNWLTPGLVELFKKAGEFCQKKAGRRGRKTQDDRTAR
jgi:hypothetical protein